MINAERHSAAIHGGSNLSVILFGLFLALKLAGVITWSWWWVAAPLWLPITLVLTFALGIFLLSLTVMGLIGLAERRKR